MGFLSRLFGRVQEEPLARPEPQPPPGPDEPPEAEAPVGPELVEEPPADPESEAQPEFEAEPGIAAEPETSRSSAGEPDRPLPPAPARERRAVLERPRPAPTFPSPPEPQPGPALPKELSLSLDDATAALRSAGSDGIRIGFISREYLRASEEERAGARRKLVEVLTEQLRARGLLAEDGTFELREERPVANAPGG